MTWERVSLGDVIRPLSARQVPDPLTELPYIGMENVEAQSGRLRGTDKASSIKSACPLVQSGDVLYGRLRPYLNKVAIAPECAFASGEFIVFRANSRLDAKFLKWRLTAQDFVDYAVALNTGDRPRVKWPQMSNFRFSLPPMEEQRRIVAILEDHLSRLDAADHQLRAATQRADVLLRAALSVGLRGGLVPDDLSDGSGDDLAPAVGESEPSADERWWSVPDSWKWVRLGDVFEINVGATPPRGDQQAWKGDLPWVASGEVSFRRIETTREHIARAAAGNPQRRIHPPGTVLLAMIGEGKTRGQAAILDVEAAHNQNCASIRVSETEILPEYVYGYLEERYLETRRGGAGGQQPALNKAAIQTFLFPLAPLATQRALVSCWESLREERARLNSALDQAARRSAALRRSLLAAAFSGRLTGSSSEMSVVEGRIEA